jgi:ABC-type multidrug transport system fused ATPase/permease subunit
MTYFKIFKSIWLNFEPSRRLAFIKLLFLILTASITEILSIGSLVPFVNIISSEDSLKKMPLVTSIFSFFGFSDYNNIVILITCCFLTIVIIGGVLRFSVLKLSSSLSFESGTVLSAKIYKNVLSQDYAIQIQRNTSELISNISIKSNALIYGFLYPIVNIIQALVLSVLMLITLFYIDFASTFLLLSTISTTYYFLYRVVNRQLNMNAIVISKEQSLIVQNLREGFGSIRDILLNRSFDYFINRFYFSDAALRRAQGSNAFLSGFPKFIIETVGVLIIGYLILMSLIVDGSINKVVPLVIVIAFAAQRMLPTLQLLFHSLSSIKGNIHSVKESVAYLQIESKEFLNFTSIKFKSAIQLRDVFYHYPTSENNVLENVCLTIEKGDIVGIIGETGSGKSTLIDIVASLLIPTRGNVYVDDYLIDQTNTKEWMKNISYLSQNNFFLDLSFSENIAFGVEKDQINYDLVKEAIDTAVLREIVTQKGGLSFKIGENGCNLSGGQKQRLALARILYKQAPVIIIDEGTSALDKETEIKVFESLRSLHYKPTIIFITHNHDNLIHCNKIVEVDRGKVNLIKVNQK